MTNHWHEKFKNEVYMYGKEANAFVQEIAKQLPEHAKVLCIAEGEGRNAVYLASLGHDVTAWDYAQSGLDKTENLAKEQGVKVQTVLCDLATVDWEQEAASWDVIVHIFGHLPKEIMDRTIEGVQQALVVGGSYVSEMYTTEQLDYGTGGPPTKSMLIEPATFLQAFSQFFITHFYVGEVVRHEGVSHTGKSHVVQSFLRKR